MQAGRFGFPHRRAKVTPGKRLSMHSTPPLSVVIPVLDGAALLRSCMAALAEGRARGLIGEIIVVGGGSRDGSQARAVALGARVLSQPAGRGGQLAAGAAAATGAWLLFLHADTELSPGWSAAVAAFLAAPENHSRAGDFRLRLDGEGGLPRWLEAGGRVGWRVVAFPGGQHGRVVGPGRLGSPLGLLAGADARPLRRGTAVLARSLSADRARRRRSRPADGAAVCPPARRTRHRHRLRHPGDRATPYRRRLPPAR